MTVKVLHLVFKKNWLLGIGMTFSGSVKYSITKQKLKLNSVFQILIRMFFSLPDPDPLVGGTDPDTDPSIIK